VVTHATLDGRKSGTPLAEGCSPTQGTDVRGPTAAVRSVAKIDHVNLDAGTLYNLKLNPQSVEDESGMRKWMNLIRTYFDLGGHHIQFNVVTADTLRAAQKRPEKYRDLLVRVAGYSAFFVTMDKALQDDIIARTEHVL
jgi:formate C-acetyltransferase